MRNSGVLGGRHPLPGLQQAIPWSSLNQGRTKTTLRISHLTLGFSCSRLRTFVSLSKTYRASPGTQLQPTAQTRPRPAQHWASRAKCYLPLPTSQTTHPCLRAACWGYIVSIPTSYPIPVANRLGIPKQLFSSLTEVFQYLHRFETSNQMK